ncbi:P-loop containing nucleoside triphosphate hydrolases superfamily protein [Hibiscus syriacus]|uniref:P-loop containing nucleoside triphosphate hydrolases superfamily protein n=1 Tax=Hibiscus syriacus TaxID=106335 RepID=A0A6A2ZCY9_HIBSY|nr:P-loop containing nucleoside triphosphate hydrolases superfamily protein [Hibiscus syriacus]
MNCTLESVNYLEDPDMNSVEHHVPDPSQEETMINPCTLQLTVFKCGGFVLGAAIQNSLCDGLGATQFFCMAADIARGVNRLKFQHGLGPSHPVRSKEPYESRSHGSVVKPAFPAGYWGNGCVAMYANVSAKDLIEQPLWKMAELIKKSKSNASDELVRFFIDLQ